ncbi:hypothetical protein M8J75_005324 [Diaphorina citri]|nr:hypothetical protein M8J75_005324 [Diaphorina citri]
MDLFVVNRYYGNETSSNFLIDKSTPQTENKCNQNEEEPTKVKKRKKRDIDVNGLPNNECNFITEDEVCDTTLLSKKKKSKEKQCDDDTCEDNNTQDAVCTNVENSRPKRKKSKTCEISEEINDESSIKKKKKKSLTVDNRNIEDECATQENIVKPESTEQDTRENGLNNIESIENTSKKQKSNKHPLSNELVATNVTESPSQKKKKRKSGIDSNEISTEENLNTKSQEFTKNKIDEAHDKLSNKTSKRKSEKISTSVDREESKKDLEQNDVPRDRMKKQTLEVPAAIEKDCPIKPVSNVEIYGGKFKKMRTDENTNAISNKTKIDNNNSEIKKVESKSDETSKKGKKRFRQRARYKNKPKNEENKDEGNKPEEEDKEDESSEEEHDKENTNDLGGFQVIGNLEFQKKKKVKRVLPDWLAKPTVISVDLKNLNSKVEDLAELNPYFKKLLRRNEVTNFFPVQSELIPFLIKQHSRRSLFWPRDICVSAPTGSGKTLAFVLPILQILQYRVVPRIRALVVLPTQDLASQVYSVFKTYIKGTKLQVVLTVGSTPMLDEQRKLVAVDKVTGKHVSLVDIVVTTPGRLVDHLTNSPGFDLSELKFLVVDEADRMIDNNDCNWLLHINKHINYQGLNSVPPLSLHTFLTYPSRPQRLLFSATLSHDPEKLHQLSLFQPKLFTSVVEPAGTGDTQPTSSEAGADNLSSGFIGKFTTPAELSEKLTTCSTNLKPLVLYQLIRKHAMQGVLCFVNTAQGAHRLARLLHHIDNVATKGAGTKMNIAEVYSDLKFDQRNKIIQEFRRRKIDLVVASDNLARGIDVENIDVVINYEAPDNIKKYIHRIGRTARGGRQGTSVTLRSAFLKMLSSVGKQNIEDLECTEEELEHLEDVYAKALELLKKDVEREGEMTMKIAKAQKKGKNIKKKNKKLLDGSSKKNVNTNASVQKSSKAQKKSDEIVDKEVKTVVTEKKSAKVGDEKVKIAVSTDSPTTGQTSGETVKTKDQKMVKRSEIKKVVKKNAKTEGKNKFSKKNKPNKKKNQEVKKMKNEGEKKSAMKRNKKIKLKKLLKKQKGQNKIGEDKAKKS